MNRRRCYCGDFCIDGKATCGDWRCGTWRDVRHLFPQAPPNFNPQARVVLVACNECSAGLMDARNPHLWGLCACTCHRDVASAAGGAR